MNCHLKTYDLFDNNLTARLSFIDQVKEAEQNRPV